MAPVPLGLPKKAAPAARSSLSALPNVRYIEVRSDAATPTEKETFAVDTCPGHIAARSETDHSSRSSTYRRMDTDSCIAQSSSGKLASTCSCGITSASNDTLATASLKQSTFTQSFTAVVLYNGSCKCVRSTDVKFLPEVSVYAATAYGRVLVNPFAQLMRDDLSFLIEGCIVRHVTGHWRRCQKCQERTLLTTYIDLLGCNITRVLWWFLILCWRNPGVLASFAVTVVAFAVAGIDAGTAIWVDST